MTSDSTLSPTLPSKTKFISVSLAYASLKYQTILHPTFHSYSLFSFFFIPSFRFLKYPFSLASKSSKVPSSTIFPSSMTARRLHCLTVVSLWATMIEVRLSMTSQRAIWTLLWLSSSKALVASSSSKIDGLRTTALAIAILCFQPPDNLLPLMPHWMSQPLCSQSKPFSASDLESIRSLISSHLPSFLASSSSYLRVARVLSYSS